MQTFNKRHFEEILKPCLLDRHESVRVDGESLQMPMDEQYFSVNEAGVFPGIKYNAEWLTSETLLLRWRPARELDDPTIEVAETPMLPFDFTAKQLAAFMLAGPGSLVADFYGDWGDGPDSASLRHIDPDSKAHTAIVQAYAVYRETEKIVGPYPLELDAKAERARKAWNDADSETDKETKTVRGLEMEATAAEAKAAQGKWLEAMVRVLLQSAPPKSTTTAAPPVVASDCNALPVFGHSTKTRRNDLTPVIEQAQMACKDRTDTAEVWATLQVLAEKKTPPLIGATEDGLQYLKNGNAAIFTRDALRKRLAR